MLTRAHSPRCLVLISLIFATVVASVHADENCAVTLPESSQASAAPMNPPRTHGWYGTNALAALIPINGIWIGMGPARNYGDKFWWWRLGYDPKTESSPKLTVRGTRLDGPAQSIAVNKATNGFGENWSAMLVGMEFTAPGCWEVIGTYNERELRIVMQVGE